MRKKMYSTPVVVLTIIGACLTLIGNCVSVGVLVKKAATAIVSDYSLDDGYDYEYYDEYGTDDSDVYGSDLSEEDMEGVDPSTEALSEIPTYEAEGTTVTYQMESYQLQKKLGDNGMVLLDVQYPVILGTDDAQTDAINEMLKDQAMVSADNYYLNVAGQSNVKAGADGYIYIISEVTYQVTYLSNDFISVVFEDNYCAGDYDTHYIDMRTSNIDLTTGKSYELNQIVNADSDMAKDFQQRLDDKYQYNEVIYGIDTEEYTSMISGEKERDDSFMGFYRTEDGIQLYVTFHYFMDEGSSVGWFTAPYTFADMKSYQNDSDFWNIAQ